MLDRNKCDFINIINETKNLDNTHEITDQIVKELERYEALGNESEEKIETIENKLNDSGDIMAA